VTPEELLERQVKAWERIATGLERIALVMEQQQAPARSDGFTVESGGADRPRYYGQRPQQAETTNVKTTRTRPRQASRS
jgi:hypothetical protein